MESDDLGYYRQMKLWAIANNIITMDVLEDIRYFLLVRFKAISNVEIECDPSNYNLKLFITLKWYYRIFLKKKNFFTQINLLIKQYLPNYTIEVS